MSREWRFVAYMITNMVTGMQYVGITSKSLKWRWTRHVVDSRVGANKNLPLYNALRKYGKEAFYVEELCHCETWQNACLVERTLISERTTRKPRGYNLTDGGEGTLGYKMPEAAVEAMRKRMLGSKRSPEAIAKTVAFHLGRKRSLEFCLKMRQRRLSDETKTKLSAAAKAQHKRSPIPLAQMQKAWAASQRAGISEDGKRRISIANSGPRSDTCRMMMRMGRKFAKDRREELKPPSYAGSLAILGLMSMGM
jgi:Pseudomonas phage homing endonuclease